MSVWLDVTKNAPSDETLSFPKAANFGDEITNIGHNFR